MNVHVHVEWLQECYEYGTSYRTLDPLFSAFFYLSCTAGCVRVVTGSPSTSSSLVMSWSGSRSSVRLPSSSPSVCTLLLMSYYVNKANQKIK